MLESGDLALLDLETTGGDASRDRIVEIGLCLVEGGEMVGEWCALVNPERPLPPFVEKVTGIADALLAGAPTFADLKDELLGRLRGRLIVAHNARFDYGFLRQEFLRQGVCFQAPVLCTVRLSRRLYPHHRRHGLDALIERHGLRCDRRHRALADARVLWDFLRALRKDFPPETLAAAVARVLRPSPALRHPPSLPLFR